MHKARYWDEGLKEFLSTALDSYSEKIHIVKTVDEILFSGYQDDLLDLSRDYGLDENPLPFDKFGYFYNVRIIKYFK